MENKSHLGPAPILYAEDSGDAILFMEWAVARAKLANPLIIATDGLDAQRKLRAFATSGNPPGLIILDVKMPYMRGFDLLRWLREEPAYAQTVVVMLSTSDIEEDIAAAKTFGADGYFLKRSRRELDELIHRLIPLIGRPRAEAQLWNLPVKRELSIG